MDHSLDNNRIDELKELARNMRISLLKALAKAGSGHTAGPLGMADIFAVLYGEVLRARPQEPLWEERDLVVLSNGHICPVLYAAMTHVGYAPVEEFEDTLRKYRSRFQGHPHREWLPGLETSSGPLGSGLSQSIGMCIANSMDKEEGHNDRFVYCFMGDGEHDCGQLWEAVLLAGHLRVPNLIGVVDRNHIQIDGKTEDILGLEPFADKYRSFGWDVIDVDGHNIEDIYRAFFDAREKAREGNPTIIIAETVPSKGVPEFENDYRWHGAPPGKGPDDVVPKEKQLEVALERVKENS